MQEPPDGYEEPVMVWLVEYQDSREPPGWRGQVGGFFSEAEAQRLLDRVVAEGKFENAHINVVPIHRRVEDWEYDR